MTEKKNKDASVEEATSKKTCGIIMPIAEMGDYEATHWVRVKAVLDAAIREAGFEPRIVSDSDAVTVIHGNIVQNLYDDEIVVCDVSGKNPNVMFELGMRLAFDKPTIVVKDDETGYSFDTGQIKHIQYRRDQRFDDVESFKVAVTRAITSTMERKAEDPNFSPFLKYFRHITAKKLATEEISQGDFILRKIEGLERAFTRLQVALPEPVSRSSKWVGDIAPVPLVQLTSKAAARAQLSGVDVVVANYMINTLANMKNVPPDVSYGRIRDFVLKQFSGDITPTRVDELFSFALSVTAGSVEPMSEETLKNIPLAGHINLNTWS